MQLQKTIDFALSSLDQFMNTVEKAPSKGGADPATDKNNENAANKLYSVFGDARLSTAITTQVPKTDPKTDPKADQKKQQKNPPNNDAGKGDQGAGGNNNENNDIKNQVKDQDGYKMGDFVQFAKRVQSKISQKESFIKKVAREAVYSYQKQIRQNQQEIKRLLHLDTSQKSLLSYFDMKQERLKQYMENQVQYTLEEVLKSKNDVDIEQTLKLQIKRKIALSQTAVVDDKYLSISRLKLQERFYKQKFLFLPTDVKNLYVMVDDQGKSKKVNFFAGTFFDRQTLKRAGESVKQQILGMVILYLKQQGILLQKQQNEGLIQAVNSLIKQIRQKPA